MSNLAFKSLPRRFIFFVVDCTMLGEIGAWWWQSVGILGFLGFGIYLVIKARTEEGGYFSSLSTRPDVRRFLERRSVLAFISLRVGGRISIAVGLGLLVLAGYLWYRG